MNLNWAGIVLITSIGLAQAPTESAATPKFEVASVKPNKSPDLCKALTQLLPGGRFVTTNMPLMQLIAMAWNLPFQTQRITLAPGVKMPDEIYDMEASAEKGTFPPGIAVEERANRTRLMVQALLEDRFKLRIRREPKEQPVYTLVVGKGGLKMEKSKFQEPECHEEIGPKILTNPACHFLNGGQNDGFHGGSVTIAQVVEYANDFTDRPLFDKTGLTGFYDVQTEGWAPMRIPDPGSCDAATGTSDRPTLFNVFEKLGLQMESQRATIDMFVIDHVERPSEN